MFFWNRNKDEAMSSSKNKADGGPPKVVSIAASALGGVDEDESVVTHATVATSGSATGGAINNNDNRVDARPPPRSTATVGSDASTRSGGRGHTNLEAEDDDDASSVMMNLLSALSFQPTPQQQQLHHHDDYHGKDLVSGPLAPLLIPLDAGEEDDDSEDSVPTSLVGHKASALLRVKGAGFDVPPGVILTTKFFEPWIDEIRSSKEWDAAVDRLRHSVRVRSSAAGIGGDAIARPGDEAELRHCLDRLKKRASSLHLTKLQRAQMTAVGEELGASMGGTYAIRPSSTEYDVGITSLYGGSLNVRDSPSDHHRGLIRAIQKCWCSCLEERVLTLKIENRLNHHLGDEGEDDDEEASYLLPDLAVLIQTMVPNLYVSGVAYSINPTNNDHDQIVIRAAYGAGGGHHTKSPDKILVDSTTRSIVKYDVGGKGVHEAKVAAAEQRCLEEVHVRHVADAAAQIQHSSLYHGSSPPPVDMEWAVDARDQLHVLQVRPMVTGYVPMDRSVRTQPGAEHKRRLYLDGNLMWGGTDMSTSPMSNDILSRGVRHVVGTILMGRSPGSISSADIDLKKGMGLYTDSCRCYLDLSMYLPLLMGSPTGRMTAMMREANPIIAAILDKNSSQPNEEEEDDDEWWDHLDAYRPPELPKHLRTSSLLYWAPGVAWRSRKLLISYWEANNRPTKFWRDYRRVTSDFENWANDPDSIGGAVADRTTTTVADCLEEGMKKFVDVTLRATLPALILYERSARRIGELVAEASSSGDDGCSPEEVRRIVDDLLLGGGRTFDEDGDRSTVRMGLDLVEMANMLPPSSYSDLDALADAIENRDGGGGGGRLLPPGFLPRWDAFVASHGLRGPSESDVASPKYGDTPQLLLRQMAAVSQGGTSTSSRSLNLQDDDPRERQRNAVFRREEVLNELVRTLPRGKGRELRRCHDDCVRYADASDTIRRHLLQVQGRVWLSLVDRARTFVELGWLDRAEDVFQLHVGDVDEATVLAAASASTSSSSGAGESKKKRSKKNVDLRALVRKRGEFYRRVTATTTDTDGSKQRKQQGVVAVPHFPPVIDSRGRIFRWFPTRPYPEGCEAGSSLVGTAASPGVARGPVRILRGCGGGCVGGVSRSVSKSRSARHPPIFRPGDVLVAPAADMGYIAPLLVGAAAVIFEVDGGCRGRGETLAREYGTPCVSGVEGATEILRDGRIVEVDGDAGVIRFVSDSTQFGLQ